MAERKTFSSICIIFLFEIHAIIKYIQLAAHDTIYIQSSKIYQVILHPGNAMKLFVSATNWRQNYDLIQPAFESQYQLPGN